MHGYGIYYKVDGTVKEGYFYADKRYKEFLESPKIAEKFKQFDYVI